MNLNNHEKIARTSLRRSRLIATSLLILAAIGYVLTIKYAHLSPYMIYLKAFCEASMVGGLADWFAVVALFRRPLGLPIPNTAILPNNQTRIAKQVGSFIENNFLQPSLIANKIYHYQPSLVFLTWLSETDNQKKLASILSHQLSKILSHIQIRWVSQLLLQTAQNKLTGEQLGYYLAILLVLLKNNGYDKKMFDHGIRQIRQWLQDPKTRKVIEDNINHSIKKINPSKAQSGWRELLNLLKGDAADLMDGWLASKIINWANEYCESIAEQPNHFARKLFQQKWQQLTGNLVGSPLFHKKLSNTLDKLLALPDVEGFIEDHWSSLQQWFNQDTASDTSKVTAKISQLLNVLGQEILDDPKRLRKLDIQLALFSKQIISKYKSTAANYIESRISEWNNKELVKRLELNVGKDLQYIRVNGTLVGGLVGLIICLITQLFT